MEKSRAIELLKLAVPIKALTQQEYADFVEAVNMGMDALEQPTSPDTIDRQAAIDVLDTGFWGVEWDKALATAMIKDLPPAQPEPHEGHWIGKYPTTHICSECGWLIPDSKVKVFAYCPNCGARMKGEI